MGLNDPPAVSGRVSDADGGPMTDTVNDQIESPVQCRGFQAAGVAAGIKKPGVLDLGLIYSEQPAAVAALFTRNQVQAAPVQLTRRRAAHGMVRAVVVNAGNANCCNGPQGMADAIAVTADVASKLNLQPDQVLAASTGVIGAPLPVHVVIDAADGLVKALRPEGWAQFARAIMTTDTVPKLVQRQAPIDGRAFTVVAAAKGAGMIRPDMATMLCFVCTDLKIPAADLKTCLTHAADRSLNRITIDGDTSTNDTVLIMANGASQIEIQSGAHLAVFQDVLDDVLMDVARRLVKDGEGVTKMVEIKVKGAESDADALRVADTVAHSPLVKTAFFGEDANWGRIMCAVGRSGAALDPERIDIYFDDVLMVRDGRGCGRQAEAQVTRVLKQPELSVTIDLGRGSGRGSMLTCDFSLDYVKINADYRS
jgi:glutamate N-acetyltransferase/amino-acid N-acetyltransferase